MNLHEGEEEICGENKANILLPGAGAAHIEHY